MKRGDKKELLVEALTPLPLLPLIIYLFCLSLSSFLMLIFFNRDSNEQIFQRELSLL